MRDYCKDLLGAEELERYRQVYDESNDDESHQSEWEEFLKQFYPDDEYVSVHEGRYDIDDDSEEKAELTCKRLIAYHQLKAYSLYLEDKPAELAAYREFLVSVYSLLHDILLS